MKKLSPLVQRDPYLKPYATHLERRSRKAVLKALELSDGAPLLSAQCNNHLYYGLHETEKGWVFRERAPYARQLFLMGEFSYWKVDERYALHPLGNGDWEIELPRNFLHHGMLYKLWMVWQDGAGERLPAYARRVVQDEQTKIFSAQVWNPQPFRWHHATPPRPAHPLIYEAHVGMSSEEGKVASFSEFEKNVLPKIRDLGYNTLQLMAVQEHPYYGSFGYQVANFFAPSSRFGTPEELKSLIDTAHAYGLCVIMDVVHSHAVSNEQEGLALFDGSQELYFHAGERGRHPVWDSCCFNYGKNDTLMFLLSNLKYWMEEFRFDGFRFDGVTSMCYLNHGIGVDFLEYSQYFDGNVDEDALTYLYLANRVVHELDDRAFTVAEDVSGMPGLAFPAALGGVGFDYRMSMGIADFWTKTVKKVPDEQWHVGDIYFRLTDHRPEERVISYAESHDQAMVGDQTLIFRLIGSKMYDRMSVFTPDLEVDRGIALHKLITFSTLALCDGGFLNFMGNEFGHPEWIDFPREGNGWSYHYARRQWSLSENRDLKYRFLLDFHQQLVAQVKSFRLLDALPKVLMRDIENQVLAFERNGLVCVLNFNPSRSVRDYPIHCDAGEYEIAFNSDRPDFGGFGLIDESVRHFSVNGTMKVYVPARVAVMYKKIVPLQPSNL